MNWRPLAVCGVLMTIAAGAAAAQPSAGTQGGPPPLATPAASREPASVTAGWQVRSDTHQYRFENPSSFDTTTLVPHFYEQTYDIGNQWLTLRARYGVLGQWLETDVDLAFRGIGVGDDYDTFFQPGGDIVTYGTTAVTSVGAFRLAQRTTLGTVSGLTAWVGYEYRRDRAEFRPSDSVTRHTNPPSESRFFNTDRETTVSAVQGAWLGVTRTALFGRRWHLTAGVDLSPVTLAKLTTILPDKYPGQDIVALAKGFSLRPSVRLSTSRGPLALGLTADYARTWPYGSANRFTRDWVGVGAFVGWSAKR